MGLILGLDFHNLLHAKRKKKAKTLWQRSYSHTLWSASWQFAVSQVSWLEETESEVKVRPEVQQYVTSLEILNLAGPGPFQHRRPDDLNIEDFSAWDDFASCPSSHSSSHPISESIIPLRNVLSTANVHTSLILLHRHKKKKTLRPVIGWNDLL